MTTTNEDPCAPGAPYLAEEQLRSGGRVLLARALEEYVGVEWGIGPSDLAAVFMGGETSEGDAAFVEPCLRVACGMLLDLILAGRLRTFTRTIGGGIPTPLATSLWEIDDVLPRFATSAINPDAPFDDAAPRTHWILVDADDLAEIVTRLCEGPDEVKARWAAAAIAEGPPAPAAAAAPIALPADPAPIDGFLKLEDVERLTKMSRSTIYAKVARRDFPEPVRLGARFSRWRTAEVEAWLRDPR